MEKKIWRPIVFAKNPDMYEVSDAGDIRNVISGRVLKQHKNERGYYAVSLNGKTYSSARIVAMTFIPNPHEKPEVNHINGVKHDNRVENLEWATRKENMRHAVRTGLHKSRISDDDVLFIREKYKDVGSRKLSEMFGISQSYARSIATHRYKKHTETQTFQTSGEFFLDKPRVVLQFKTSGEFVKKHKSIKACVKWMETNYSAIKRVLDGERKSHKGYVFKYKKK